MSENWRAWEFVSHWTYADFTNNSSYVHCCKNKNGLKGQCVLVPADIQEVQTILPRSYDDEYLIALALNADWVIKVS